MGNRRSFFAKPRLEALEDRLLLAALIDTWVGGVSDSYSVAANWDKNQVPGAGDTVILGANSQKDVTLTSDVTIADLEIQSGFGNRLLQLGNHVLDVTADFDMAGGGVCGAAGGGGLLAVQDNNNPVSFDWSGGDIGRLVLIIGGAAGGSATWAGGAAETMLMHIAANTTLTLAPTPPGSSTPELYGSSILNEGTVEQENSLVADAGVASAILNTGSFEVDATSKLGYRAIPVGALPAPLSFNNLGSFQVAAGATSTVEFNFLNQPGASIRVDPSGPGQTTSLYFRASGAFGGATDVGVGSTISFGSRGSVVPTGGRYTAIAGSTFTGGGVYEITERAHLVVAASASVRVSNLVMDGEAGGITGANEPSVEVSGRLSVGSFDFQAGKVSSPPNSGGMLLLQSTDRMTLSTDDEKTFDRVQVVNYGTIFWTGGNIVLANMAGFVLNGRGGAPGAFEIDTNGTMSLADGNVPSLILLLAGGRLSNTVPFNPANIAAAIFNLGGTVAWLPQFAQNGPPPGGGGGGALVAGAYTVRQQVRDAANNLLADVVMPPMDEQGGTPASPPGTVAVPIVVFKDAINPEGDPLTITSVTSPSFGSVARSDNGTPGDPTDDYFVYTPGPSFNGSDGFTYLATNSDGETATVTVIIQAAPPAPTASVRGVLWADQNGDGSHGPSEPGEAGQFVYLYDDTGDLIDATTSGSDGSYTFSNLAAGNYSVGAEVPFDTTYTSQHLGANGTFDSQADPTTGLTPAFAVAANAVRDHVDIGFVDQAVTTGSSGTPPADPQTGTVEGWAFRDDNMDHLWSANEYGIANILVDLIGPGGTTLSAWTDSGGFFELDDVTPGSYALQAPPPSGLALEGYYLDDGTAVPSGAVNVAAGQADDLDAAFIAVASTTTTLTASIQAVYVGQPVTFTATVSSATGSTPTGTVDFYSGGTWVGSGTLSASAGTSAQAAFSTGGLAVGTNNVYAVYGGDAADAGSTSPAVTVSVRQAMSPAAVGLTSSATTITANQSVTFTAAVSGSGATPTGSVTFLDGSTSIGTAMLNSGVASLSTSTLTVGAHSITAVYGGDTSHGGATSQPLTQTVQQAGTGAATISLSSSTQSTTVGQSISLSALVSPPPGGATPTGSVTFLDNGNPIASVALSSYMGTTMRAVYATSALSVGAHSITACYGGGGVYTSVTSTPTLVTVQRGSVLLMESTGSSSAAYGTALTFTATIEYAQGPPPTGVISFYDGTTLVATASLTLVNGYYQATFTTAALGRGGHTINATYGGDANYQSATASLSESIY